jgi:regulator of RNase E activity RraA
LRARYLQLNTAGVFDVLDTMGLPQQVLSRVIQPLDGAMVVAGPAVTTKIAESVEASSLKAPTPSEWAFVDELYDGCVLVMDVGYTELSAPWGGNASVVARREGCTGVVIDGLTRDLRQIVELGYPVFARGATPVFSRERTRTLDVNVPIRVAGQLSRTVTVYPGDFVFGDGDGILVVPAELALAVLEAAERVEEIEQDQFRRLLAGEDRQAVYNRDRYAHVRRLDDDVLARLLRR